MDSMFINKIAGAVLLTVLIGFVITELSHVLVHPHKYDTVAYPVPDLPEAGAGATAEAVDEGPSLAVLLAEADATKGAKVFGKCQACHAIEEGKAKPAGPGLFGVLDREIGATDFAYSGDLKAVGGTWTYDQLNAFLTKPKDFAKGTKMSFPGLKKAGDRADVILFLRANGDADTPLPAAE